MPLDPGSLRSQPIADLVQTARAHNIENASSLKKPDLVAAILTRVASSEALARGGDPAATTTGTGVLETLPDGFGFLRAPEYSFLPGPDDIYVSPSQIRRFNLRTGDLVRGQVRAPKENERYFALIKVEAVNDQSPDAARDKVLFENLTAVWPARRIRLGEGGEPGTPDDVAMRLMDVVTPVGLGQRAIIAGAPRTGRTGLLRAIGRSIARNHPNVALFVTLLGERPEDVTEIERTVPGIHVATTFDEPDSRHVQVAEMVIERAKRLVEQRQDVVVLVDSLSQLARAAHTTLSPAGRSLPGGLDAAATLRVRRLLGSARSVREGGSLTVIGTIDADPVNESDRALLTELRAGANLELALDATLAERGMFPAFDLRRSRTLREELLVGAAELGDLRARRAAAGGSVEAALAALGFGPA